MVTKDIPQPLKAIPQIKPIQTWWNGLYFRSRLEARWALFYDKLEIPYEYEKEGYDLGDGVWYLPDFWLPKQDCFIEVKGQYPNAEESRKAELLCIKSQRSVFVTFGQIGSVDSPDYPNYHEAFFPEDGYVAQDSSYLWCRCRECGKFGIQFEARSERICRHTSSDWGEEISDDILIAYRVARAWRFEDSPPLEWELRHDAESGRCHARRPNGAAPDRTKACRPTEGEGDK